MSKNTYEPPAIVEYNAGQLSKYSSSAYGGVHNVRTEIDGHNIKTLTESYGSPLFVFSEKALREKIRHAKDVFQGVYENLEFAWSYKTNYLDAICQIFHQEGAIAEVVSAFEYQKARHLGIKGEDIIFNGPTKSNSALRLAIKEQAKIHIDHIDEIEDIQSIAEELDMTAKVAIRINLDSGIMPQWCTFGFNLESKQAYRAAKHIAGSSRLELIGIHCHMATYILDPVAYKRQIIKMVEFGYQLQDDFGHNISYYDIGGGLPSKSRLKEMRYRPGMEIPMFEAFAEKMAEGLHEALKDKDRPKIYMESGRALVDEAGYLITTVQSVKRMPTGLKTYVIDAGVNLLYTSTWYDYQVDIDEDIQGMSEPSQLKGPLCMNIDVVEENIYLPPLKRGSQLVLSPVGAYNVTQWMQFIEYRPAVVLLGENGEVDVIRKAETLDDIISNESVPKRLNSV